MPNSKNTIISTMERFLGIIFNIEPEKDLYVFGGFVRDVILPKCVSMSRDDFKLENIPDDIDFIYDFNLLEFFDNNRNIFEICGFEFENPKPKNNSEKCITHFTKIKCMLSNYEFIVEFIKRDPAIKVDFDINGFMYNPLKKIKLSHYIYEDYADVHKIIQRGKNNQTCAIVDLDNKSSKTTINRYFKILNKGYNIVKSDGDIVISDTNPRYTYQCPYHGLLNCNGGIFEHRTYYEGVICNRHFEDYLRDPDSLEIGLTKIKDKDYSTSHISHDDLYYGGTIH